MFVHSRLALSRGSEANKANVQPNVGDRQIGTGSTQVGLVTLEEYCWGFTYWANKKFTRFLADPAALRPPRAFSSAVEGTGLGR